MIREVNITESKDITKLLTEQKYNSHVLRYRSSFCIEVFQMKAILLKQACNEIVRKSSKI